MSIQQRNGRFQARTQGRSQTFDSQREAEKWIAGVEFGYVHLNPAGGDLPTTVGQMLTYVYENRWSGMRSEEDLFRNGQHVVETLGEGGPITMLAERRSVELVRNRFKDRVSPATVNRKLSALSALMTSAYDLGLIDGRPSIKKEREPEGRQRFLTDDEETAVLNWLEDHHPDLVDIVTFLLDTGMRVNEALSMEWSSLQGSKVTLNPQNTKSKRSRTIPLTTAAMSVLMRRRNLQRPFEGIHYRRLAMRFGQAVENLHLGEVTLHTLRHTFASKLVQRGVDLYVVAHLLGHSSVTVTERYAHLKSTNMDEAIDILQGSMNGNYARQLG